MRLIRPGGFAVAPAVNKSSGYGARAASHSTHPVLPSPVLLALLFRVLPGENSLGPSCFRASAAARRHPSCIVSQSVRSLVVRIRLSRCEPEPLLQATAPLAPTDNPRPRRRPGQVYRMYQYYVPLGLQASVLSPERLGRDFIIMGAPLRVPDASIWPASDATSSRTTHLTAASAQGRIVRCGSCQRCMASEQPRLLLRPQQTSLPVLWLRTPGQG